MQLLGKLQDKRIVVAGWGISARSVTRILRSRNNTVIVVDEREPSADIHKFSLVDFTDVDVLVVSPGFAPSHEIVVKAQKYGVPVVSEVEIAWLLREDAPWIGITGTNGKTTTTQLVSAMLQAAGFDAPVAGNIGEPISQVASYRHDVVCAELSSFQLHFTYSLQLQGAVITNLAQDHIDWHGSFENYVHDKASIYNGVTGTLVWNADDEKVSAVAQQVCDNCNEMILQNNTNDRNMTESGLGCHSGNVVQYSCNPNHRVGFTLKVPKEGQLGIDGDWIIDRSGLLGLYGEPFGVVNLAEIGFIHDEHGGIYQHLLADVLAALALVLGFGADKDKAVRALSDFTPSGHRIAKVGQLTFEYGGAVDFIDDSKATNAHAAHASLQSYADDSVIWIAGGLAKGASFDDLVKDCAHKIKTAILIGRDKMLLQRALQQYAPQTPVYIIDEKDGKKAMYLAVKKAAEIAQLGSVVLLAPACASMDQFDSYKERGDIFAQAVHNL